MNVAVADGGSISEGARRLELSKSVVSERLVELERSRGTRLVQRTTRRLSLTGDGLAFLERGRIVRDTDRHSLRVLFRRLFGARQLLFGAKLFGSAPELGTLQLLQEKPELVVLERVELHRALQPTHSCRATHQVVWCRQYQRVLPTDA